MKKKVCLLTRSNLNNKVYKIFKFYCEDYKFVTRAILNPAIPKEDVLNLYQHWQVGFRTPFKCGFYSSILKYVTSPFKIFLTSFRNFCRDLFYSRFITRTILLTFKPSSKGIQVITRLKQLCYTIRGHKGKVWIFISN